MNYDRLLIAGRLAEPVALRVTSKGTHAASLMLEVKRRYRGANGERKESTAVLPVSVYGLPASYAATHLKTGDQVLIEGHHRVEERTNADTGVTTHFLSIVADYVDYLNNPRHKEEAAS
ncbi:MAG: single-stranded DNA-binding protein [Acidobacteriales bacterium]|nr:single-stranded DNA-binding protein [Terriglobales bacterium]